MKLIVCAKSDDGRFIGMPSASGYTVFSADHADGIKPGDILANPTWDDEDGIAHTVRNLITDGEFKVRLENWSLTLPEARSLLEKDGTAGSITWHPPWPGT